MLLDHFFMSFVAALFSIPYIISRISGLNDTSNEQINFSNKFGVYHYFILLGFVLYFCKDVFNGRSIAKRILKLQVVDNRTGMPASPLKTLIRNIFCLIWPIEAVISVINPHRRIGDRIAGTKLVVFDPLLEQPKIRTLKALLPIAILYGLLLLMIQISSIRQPPRINYIGSSYNQVESYALKKILTDSLGLYMTPDIYIYDSIQNEKLRYIVALLNLKENYIEDNETFSKLDKMTSTLIYSKQPNESFTGRVTYLYKTKFSYRRTTNIIGTTLKRKD